MCTPLILALEKWRPGGLQIQGLAVLPNEILVLAEYSCMAADAVLAAEVLPAGFGLVCCVSA